MRTEHQPWRPLELPRIYRALHAYLAGRASRVYMQQSVRACRCDPISFAGSTREGRITERRRRQVDNEQTGPGTRDAPPVRVSVDERFYLPP